MKEMITRMREEKGGFTLAELLVVVAIIAVLVAIAIPVFSASLNKAQASTDESNIRAGYAVTQVKAIDGSAGATTEFYLNLDGSVSDTTPGTYVCLANSTDLGENINIGGTSFDTWAKGNHIKYTIGTDKKVTISVAS